MARHKRGKMALYEVMSKAREKPGYNRTLKNMREKMHGKTDLENTFDEELVETVPEEEVVVEKPAEQFVEQVSEPELKEKHDSDKKAEVIAKTGVQWWRKPRIIQVNAGRIEFSMPYQLAIALTLGLILAILIAFQLGQRYYMVSSQNGTENPEQKQPVETDTNPLVNTDNTDIRSQYNLPGNEQPAKPPEKPVAQSGTSAGQTETSKPSGPIGDNAIILVQYDKRADLEPVKKHFDQAGVPTEIVGQAGRYFLRTSDRYVVSSTAYTDAMEKIKEVGPQYKGKAPEGYETFAPHYFTDAYPKKVD